MNILSNFDCYVDYATQTVIDFINPNTGLTFYSGETFDQVRARWTNAAITTIDEFSAWQAARQRTPISWNETTEDEFNEMLCILPPADRCQGGFLVGEPGDHYADTGESRYQAYRETVDGRFLRSNRCLSRAEFRVEMDGGSAS